MKISGFNADGTLSAGKFIKSMVSSLSDVLSGVVGLSVGGVAGGKIALSIKTGLSFIIEKISALFSDGSSRSSRGGGREISEELEEIGENCAEGFDNGLNSGASETTTGWVSKIVGWIKDKLGIHSPSTVFAEIGTYIMLGMLNGIASVEGSVVSAFSNLWVKIQTVFATTGAWFGEKFSGAASNIENAWSGIGTFFSDVFNNITSAFSTIPTWFHDKFTEAWAGRQGCFLHWRRNI